MLKSFTYLFVIILTIPAFGTINAVLAENIFHSQTYVMDKPKKKCLIIRDNFSYPPYGFMRNLVSKIYNHAGVCVEFHAVKGRRALEQFQSNLSDALLLRNDIYMATVGMKEGIDFIRPKQRIINTYSRILSKKNKNLGPELADFRTATIGVYRAEHLRMKAILSIYDMLPFPYETHETHQILTLIDQNRLDGILLDRIFIDYLIHRDQTILSRYEISDLFFSQPLFLILKPRYKHLIPQLNRAISYITPQINAYIGKLEQQNSHFSQ